MKIGIDSYCYHRFFGEVYPQQRKPDRGMTLEQFIARARELGAEGVSLESCFLPSLSAEYLGDVKAMLDEHGLDRVYAWGHPDGLEGGANQTAYEEMIASFEHARRIGAKVMRVVGSSLRFRREPHAPQLERLTAMFRSAANVARDYDIRLAVENHIDFTTDEMAQLLDAVDSPYVGINFDTGNFLRLLDDPVRGMEKLASRVYATHIKDLQVQRGVAPDEWFFFSSVPVGAGLVDNAKLVRSLAEAGFDGVLAVEIDFLHPDFNEDEDTAVAKSVQELRRLVEQSRSGQAIAALL
jgi:sugar phosphate isomerase/epimerase